MQRPKSATSQEAYDAYMKTVATDNKGKYSEFCAEAAIFAADELIKYDKKKGLVKQRKGKTDIDPIEMSPWETKKLESLDQYAKLYPDKKNAINHLYASATLLFDKNQLDEASSRFRTVISMNPKSNQAMYSANLILGALDVSAQAKEEKGNFKKLQRISPLCVTPPKAFQDQEGLGNSSFKKEMRQIYEASAIKEIEVVYNASPKADGDKRTAADSYMGFVRQLSQRPTRLTSLLTSLPSTITS